MRRVIVLVVVAAAVAALSMLTMPGCSSVKKSVIEDRLVSAAGNAPVRRVGLARRTADIPLGDERTRVEFVHYHAGTTAPNRPVVLLIHGTPSSFATWTDVVFGGRGSDGAEFAGLAQDCDVWVLEMVGHGVTRTKAAPYTFQREAQWIDGFVDTMDLRDVTIVGNSYGGEFAWRAALDRPERISKVVLMSSSGFARRDDEWLPEEVKMREMSLAKLGWLLNSRARVREALQPHFQSPVSDEHVDEVYAVCSNSDNWSAMIDLARDENGTRSGELSSMKQRALLLWGEKDVAYPIERFARQFERAIPKSRLVIVPNAGHYPQEERPEFVAARIREFAREP